MKVTLPATVPSINIGGRTFTDIGNLIVLVGAMQGATNGYSTLRKVNGTAAYTPSGTKTFRVCAIRCMSSAAQTPNITFGYADNDQGVATNTGPTNGVVHGGSQSLNLSGPAAAVSNTPWEIVTNFVVPNGKYFYCYNNAGALSANIYAYGYEE